MSQGNQEKNQSRSSFCLVEIAPEPSQFSDLRSAVGWTSPTLEVLEQSMQASLYWVSVYAEERLVGTGRVVGDGAMYFYIQDVIVHPHYQGAGLGSQIMAKINHYLNKHCVSGATVGLFAAKGKEPFYQKFAFTERDGDILGLGMCRFV
ncbi:GNAT family N-acetyltransferase [Aliiglaciecola sp. CAU 1673]|uniref:GNAT family N-acetyltransferase n=1 Tax=Aliiglaciecola sp. CAU 1673 TaxID=3032595 RepID=UPI0023DBE661|nr:GNAT family N-acetyltransferase [Aliiglaciecola sp. CAU 1673]MDF2180179.1 GNAT family N-acetyltransferase [Aliiglaciecola sp. CAU 1673]